MRTHHTKRNTADSKVNPAHSVILLNADSIDYSMPVVLEADTPATGRLMIL